MSYFTLQEQRQQQNRPMAPGWKLGQTAGQLLLFHLPEQKSANLPVLTTPLACLPVTLYSQKSLQIKCSHTLTKSNLVFYLILQNILFCIKSMQKSGLFINVHSKNISGFHKNKPSILS